MSAVGDGRKGYPEGAPYDAIHVGAAAAVVPQPVGVSPQLSSLPLLSLSY